MRVLVALGVHAQDAEGGCANTTLGEGPEVRRPGLDAGPWRRDRTADEFAALFAVVGLRLARVLDTPTEVVVLEGVADTDA